MPAVLSFPAPFLRARLKARHRPESATRGRESQGKSAEKRQERAKSRQQAARGGEKRGKKRFLSPLSVKVGIFWRARLH